MQVKMVNYLIAFVLNYLIAFILNYLIVFFLAWNIKYIYAIGDIQNSRKLLVNNSTRLTQLQSTNVQVNIHFHLTLAIALPAGAAMLSVLAWAIYKLRNMKPTQPAEVAEVAENLSIPEAAEDIVDVLVNSTTM